MKKEVQPFVDEKGRLRALPEKAKKRRMALEYLAEKFEDGREYREKEVNAICDAWHTFGDYFVLRRELVDEGFLLRLPDGSKYWKNEETE